MIDDLPLNLFLGPGSSLTHHSFTAADNRTASCNIALISSFRHFYSYSLSPTLIIVKS